MNLASWHLQEIQSYKLYKLNVSETLKATRLSSVLEQIDPAEWMKRKLLAEVLDNITEDDILFYDNWAEQQDSGALSV